MDLKQDIEALRVLFKAWRDAHPVETLDKAAKKVADELDAELTNGATALEVDPADTTTAKECYDEAKKFALEIGVLRPE